MENGLCSANIPSVTMQNAVIPRDDKRLRPGRGAHQTDGRGSDRGSARRDDDQLIDEALAGQSASFGELVTKYQDRLYNSVLHVIDSADEAYDVVQDAFVQAFIKLDSFSRQAAFYTWLYRIAFNLAVSRRRRRATGRIGGPNQGIDRRRTARQR